MNDRLEEKETIAKVQDIKDTLGHKLLILTHHYQRKEIVDLGDFKGDSFGLSQKAAADKAAEYIVFCGVHFMAESAEILSQPHQTVQIPAIEAGCWMADMADIFTVPVNLAGVPAISLPCGFSDGLPIGLQIIGRHFEEDLVFKVAHAYETATSFHLRTPEGC